MLNGQWHLPHVISFVVLTPPCISTDLYIPSYGPVLYVAVNNVHYDNLVATGYSDDEARKAVEMANLCDAIMNIPKQWNTQQGT